MSVLPQTKKIAGYKLQCQAVFTRKFADVSSKARYLLQGVTPQMRQSSWKTQLLGLRFFPFFSLCSVVEGRDMDVHSTFIVTTSTYYIYCIIYYVLYICNYVSIHILQCIYSYIKLFNESHVIWRGTHFHDSGKPHGYTDFQKSGIEPFLLHHRCVVSLI